MPKIAAAVGRSALATLFLVCANAQANTVEDWNVIAKSVATQSELDAGRAAHAMAMVHAAMFEVLNFIDPRYASRFVVAPPQPLRMSGPAAASAPAHQMLVLLYPERTEELDEQLHVTLAGIPQGNEKASAIIRRSLAGNLYALRGTVASTASAPAPGHSTQGPLAWNTVVSQLASQRHLELLDTARIHALVSMAVSHAFAEAHRCTACLAGAAVRMVLDAEFGADAAGDAIGRDVLVQWTPVRAAE